MIKLMQITGLDYPSLVEITGFLMSLISFGVFIGIVMYDIFSGFAGFIGRCLTWIADFVADHFFSRRKGRNNG